MQRISAVRLRTASLTAVLLTPLALARPQAGPAPTPSPVADDVPAQIKLLQQQLAEQRRAIEALQAALRAQPAAVRGDNAPAAAAAEAAAPADGVSTASELETVRGAGNGLPGSARAVDTSGGGAPVDRAVQDSGGTATAAAPSP